MMFYYKNDYVVNVRYEDDKGLVYNVMYSSKKIY